MHGLHATTQLAVRAEDRARLTTARFAADGLWVAKATEALPPVAEEYDALVAHLLSLTEEEKP